MLAPDVDLRLLGRLRDEPLMLGQHFIGLSRGHALLRTTAAALMPPDIMYLRNTEHPGGLAPSGRRSGLMDLSKGCIAAAAAAASGQWGKHSAQ
jgi:hypothetical protein